MRHRQLSRRRRRYCCWARSATFAAARRAGGRRRSRRAPVRLGCSRYMKSWLRPLRARRLCGLRACIYGLWLQVHKTPSSLKSVWNGVRFTTAHTDATRSQMHVLTVTSMAERRLARRFWSAFMSSSVSYAASLEFFAILLLRTSRTACALANICCSPTERLALPGFCCFDRCRSLQHTSKNI